MDGSHGMATGGTGVPTPELKHTTSDGGRHGGTRSSPLAAGSHHSCSLARAPVTRTRPSADAQSGVPVAARDSCGPTRVTRHPPGAGWYLRGEENEFGVGDEGKVGVARQLSPPPLQ